MAQLSVYARDQATTALVATAFPGSIEEESARVSQSAPCEVFDTVENENKQDKAMMDVSEDADAIQQET